MDSQSQGLDRTGSKVGIMVSNIDNVVVNGPGTIGFTCCSYCGYGMDSQSQGLDRTAAKVGIMVSNIDNVVVNGPGTISNFQAGVS